MVFESAFESVSEEIKQLFVQNSTIRQQFIVFRNLVELNALNDKVKTNSEFLTEF